jgi:hypothetical protein
VNIGFQAKRFPEVEIHPLVKFQINKPGIDVGGEQRVFSFPAILFEDVNQFGLSLIG